MELNVKYCEKLAKKIGERIGDTVKINFPTERLFANILLWKLVLYTVIYLLEKKKEIARIHE